MTQDKPTDVDVLIVGGGGCGLTAALLLADLGVDAMLIERHPMTSPLPKAHILNPRTMEIFRQAGVADEILQKGTPSANLRTTSWYTGLGGDAPWDRKMFHRIDSWGGGALQEQYAAATAETCGNMPQLHLGPLLKRHADARNPGRILFGQELSGIDQDETGVTATVLERDTGRTWQVRARYVIGADGGRTLGPLVGAKMIGRPPFIDMTSIHFRADLSPYLQDDDSVIRMITRPSPDGSWNRGGLVCQGPDRWDRHAPEWRIGVILPVHEEGVEDYSEDQARRDVRRILNLPELEMDILRISHWMVEGVVADRYGWGRVLLAGDAAHRHPPMGGLGLNSAIQDAHNIAWKLAAVLKGEAAPALLDSYEIERRPVAQHNVDWSTFNFYNHLAATAGFGVIPTAPPEHNEAALRALFSDTHDGRVRRRRLEEFYGTLRREFQGLDVELGFEYSHSPVVTGDDTPPPPRDPIGNAYIASARPGHRLPHAWLERDGRPVTTHGLLQPGQFLLIAGQKGEAWLAAAKAAATDNDAPITALAINADGLSDRDGAWARLRGHDDGGAILVRPDGHVAFRAPSASVDAARELGDALTRALGRGPPRQARGAPQSRNELQDAGR